MKHCRMMAVFAALIHACGTGEPGSDVLDPGIDGSIGCEEPSLELTGAGIRWSSGCGDLEVILLPRVRIGGLWRGGGGDGACSSDGLALTCPAGDAGFLVARSAGRVVSIRFEAVEEVEVEALSLEGGGRVEGATAWLSNGFQSWSQSGALALGAAPDADDLAAALDASGTLEVVRDGTELSWWFTWVSGNGPSLVAGALSGNRWKPWAQVHRLGDGSLKIRFVSGGTGERVKVEAGDGVDGESWWIAAGTDLQGMLTDYGKALPTRRDGSERADAGWNSWYDLWDDVDDPAVRANAALVREILQPLLPAGTPLRIVVDDGWQVLWGEWESNGKFPEGLDGLAADLSADGFHPGIWLAPLLVDGDSDLVVQHPDWFIEGARYDHPEHRWMSVLDVTHPGAAAHLTGVIETIVGWGLGLLKIDFLFAGTLEGARHQDVTAMESYRKALQIIRDAAGDDVFLLTVGAPPIAGFDLVDGWRLGPDIAYEPMDVGWAFVADEARSVAARWPLCYSILCDPDPPLLRKLPREEVESGAWVVAFAGGGLFLSDDLRELPEERRTWGMDATRVGLAVGGIPSIPEDLVPDMPPDLLYNAVGSYLVGTDLLEVPRIWRTPDGRRVALNMYAEELVVDGETVPAHTAVELP